MKRLKKKFQELMGPINLYFLKKQNIQLILFLKSYHPIDFQEDNFETEL